MAAGIDHWVDGNLCAIIRLFIEGKTDEITPTTATYIEIGCWILLAVIGIIVQYSLTGRGDLHHHRKHKKAHVADGGYLGSGNC